MRTTFPIERTSYLLPPCPISSSFINCSLELEVVSFLTRENLMKQRIILFASTTLAAFVLVVFGGIAGSLMQPKQTQLAETPAPSSAVQALKPAPFESNRESEIDGFSPVKVSEPSFDMSQPQQAIDRAPAKQVVRTYARFDRDDDGLIAYGEDHADREDD